MRPGRFDCHQADGVVCNDWHALADDEARAIYFAAHQMGMVDENKGAHLVDAFAKVPVDFQRHFVQLK